MKYLKKAKYVTQFLFGGLILSSFSYIALSYLGEIQEIAKHFAEYTAYYFMLFLFMYFLLSLAYLFFFAHIGGGEWGKAVKVEGSMHVLSILLLPYLVNFEFVHRLIGFFLFYLFLLAALGFRLQAFIRHLAKNESRDKVVRFLILMCIVLSGIVLRLTLLFTSQGVVGSEEAIMGLMARHILFNGETYTFLWGQPYMGSIEALLAVPVFFLFGASSLTLKTIPLIFSILFIITSYILVKLTLGENVGLISALLVSLSPVFLTVFSMLANAYIENLFYGSLVLILSYLIAYQSEGRRQLYLFLIIGLVAGIAFWNNLTSIIYLTAAFLFLVFEWRRWVSGFLPKILMFLGGVVFGSFPLWFFNLRHQWVTFRFLSGGLNSQTILFNRIEQIFINFGNLLGVARAIVGGGQSALTDFIVYVLYAISFLYALYFFVTKINSQYSERRNGLKIFLILVLVLAVFFSFSRYGGLNEARYALILYLILPGFLALFLRDLQKRSLMLVVILLAIIIFSNLLGNIKDMQNAPPQPQLLAGFLTSNNISYAYTDFWTAYQLTFVSKEKIVSYAISGPNVYPPYAEQVRKADFRKIAVIFDKGNNFKEFEKRILEESIKYKKKRLARKTIFYSFSRNVEPLLGLAKF